MDKLKHFLEVARKHHFWILCALSALIGVLVWMTSTGQLAAEFEANKGTISGNKQKVERVSDGQPHDDWSPGMAAETKQVQQNVEKAWNDLYRQQKDTIFVWPTELKGEFLDAVPKLDDPKPSLRPDLCALYAAWVKTFVAKLPTIVDAAPLGEEAIPATAGGAPTAPVHKVNWDQGNLIDITESFNWTEPASQLLVKYAQEELWVYEALCKVISTVNEGATGPHDARITDITEIQIAGPAAEAYFGGGNDKRIDDLPNTAPDAAPGDAPPGAPMPIKDRGKKMDLANRNPLGVDAAPASADDLLKDWRYVDKKFKPMMHADVDAAENEATRTEYNLMPFKLILKVDRHFLDRLLVAFRNSPLPMEVLQVRIGPQVVGGQVNNGISGTSSMSGHYQSSMRGNDEHATGPTSSYSSGGGGGTAAAPQERTSSVEIRGVVYLLKRPLEKPKPKPESGAPDEQATPPGTDTVATPLGNPVANQ